MKSMADGRTWSAEELLAMSPDERFEMVQAGFVDDLGQVPPEFLGRLRKNIRDHIRETEVDNKPEL